MIQNTALNCWNTLVFHTEVPSVWILKINGNQFGKCRQNASKKTYTFRLQFLPKEAAMIELIRPSLLSGEMRKRKSFLRNARLQGLLAFQCGKGIRSAFRSEGNIVARKLRKWLWIVLFGVLWLQETIFFFSAVLRVRRMQRSVSFFTKHFSIFHQPSLSATVFQLLTWIC